MSAKVPQKPPTIDELRAKGGKPKPSPPPPKSGETAKEYTARTGTKTISAASDSPDSDLVYRKSPDVCEVSPDSPLVIPNRHAFPVRVALVCPHCSSYMQRIGSGDMMTCKTEKCEFHLRKFRLPVLMAEEVE